MPSFVRRPLRSGWQAARKGRSWNDLVERSAWRDGWPSASFDARAPESAYEEGCVSTGSIVGRGWIPRPAPGPSRILRPGSPGAGHIRSSAHRELPPVLSDSYAQIHRRDLPVLLVGHAALPGRSMSAAGNAYRMSRGLRPRHGVARTTSWRWPGQGDPNLGSDFNDAEFTAHGVTSKFLPSDGQYFVRCRWS